MPGAWRWLVSWTLTFRNILVLFCKYILYRKNIWFLESGWLVHGFVTSSPKIAHAASTRKVSLTGQFACFRNARSL
jgi:hypothetical protein